MATLYQMVVGDHSEQVVIAASATLVPLVAAEIGLWVGDNIATHRHNEKQTTAKWLADRLIELGVPTPATVNAKVAEGTIEGVKASLTIADVLLTGAPTGGEDVIAVCYGEDAIAAGSSHMLAVAIETLLDAYRGNNVAV